MSPIEPTQRTRLNGSRAVYRIRSAAGEKCTAIPISTSANNIGSNCRDVWAA